ncbi:MAG: FGGY-family carbohydrate kinase [Suipraeoptans sp.]
MKFMHDYFMGLDNGGSVVKCALYDTKGNELCVTSRTPLLNTPKPGYTERDDKDVWNANIEVIRETISMGETEYGISKNDIKCVGLTGYGNGICLVDNNGKTVRPIIVSTDDRGAEMVANYRGNGKEEEVFKYTKQTMWSAMMSSLLTWVHKYEPEVIQRTSYVLGIKDYVRYHLTGEMKSEYTEASSTGLLNIENATFDPEIFRLLDMEGMEKLFPKIVMPNEISGYVTLQASNETGLPEGTPIAGGCFDVDASVLASGILNDDILCLIAGTWSINEYLIKEWNYGYMENSNTITKSFLPEYYLVEESTPTSASNLDWFVKRMLIDEMADKSIEDVYSECNEIVESIQPEESNVVFIPYLYSSATHTDAKAGFFNLSGYNEKKHLIRAIYEGVVFSSAFHVEQLMKNGKTFKIARLSGGLTKSEVWTQMMSDVLQMSIEVLQVGEIGAQGAAMCAAVASGTFSDYKDAVDNMVKVKKVYHPNPDRAQIYEKKYKSFKNAQASIDFFHEKEGE